MQFNEFLRSFYFYFFFFIFFLLEKATLLLILIIFLTNLMRLPISKFFVRLKIG